MIVSLCLRVGYLLLPLLGGAVIHGLFIKYNWLPWLYRPIDSGRRFHGKPVFGSNKTWRGILAFGIGSDMAFLVQAGLLHRYPAIRHIEMINYEMDYAWIFGFVFGTVALFGELPNSFIKRHLGIQPGMAPPRGFARSFFFVLDQIDILLGVWIVLAFAMPVTLPEVLCSVIVVFLTHLVVTLVGYRLGMRHTRR